MTAVGDLLQQRRVGQARQGAALLHQAGARRVWLFGSLARGEVSDRRTDIDFAVEGLGAEKRRSLALRLRALLRCKVDVVGIEDAGPALRRSISESRVLLTHGSKLEATALTRPRPVGLHQQRVQAVLDELKALGAASVADLGCGTGLLIERLAGDPAFQRILGVDSSFEAVESARLRLGLSHGSAGAAGRVQLLHALVTNPDPRLTGYEAVTAIEVIEHLDPERLAAFGRVVFGYIRPRFCVVTTPNAEWNVLFGVGDAVAARCRDHRFEWTRQQFQTWMTGVAGSAGYTCLFRGVGAADPRVGAPTQMAVCTLVVGHPEMKRRSGRSQG